LSEKALSFTTAERQRRRQKQTAQEKRCNSMQHNRCTHEIITPN